MRFLGIDYGAKRVGVAMSDKQGKMAFPYAVLKSSDNLAKEIKKICDKESANGGIEKIILGFPLDLKNSPTHNTKPVLDFKEKLETVLKIPIILEKEFYTTKEAERTQGKIKKIDASAAALILGHYLDKLKF